MEFILAWLIVLTFVVLAALSIFQFIPKDTRRMIQNLVIARLVYDYMIRPLLRLIFWLFGLPFRLLKKLHKSFTGS